MKNLFFKVAQRKALIRFFIFILIIWLLTGCSDSSSSDPEVLQGSFIDGAVEGLDYATRSQQGITDADGTFKYIEGEEVTFKLADIVIGKAVGDDILTPINLVEGADDETDPEVTNICRLLQALDEDGNHENGIQISEAVRSEVQGSGIDLTLPVSEFENAPSVSNLLDRLISSGLLNDDTTKKLPDIHHARRNFRIAMEKHGLISAVTPKGVYMDPNGAVDDDLSDDTGIISQRTQATVPDNMLNSLVTDNNSFCFKLYHALRQSDNFFFSPYSISSSIVMMFAGARNETSNQIAEAAHFNIEQKLLHKAFNTLDVLINSPQPDETDNVSIFTSRSAAWAQTEYTVYIDFFNCLVANYNAPIQPLDFKNKNLQSRTVIEDWIVSHTKDKVSPSSLFLPDRTRLVFANTNTFEGQWSVPFLPEQTHDGAFELAGGEIINVPMMHIEKTFNYAKGDIFEAIELGFENNRFGLLLLIPEFGRLQDFEQRLEPEELFSIIESLNPQLIELYLPQFAIEFSKNLQTELESLEMQDIWNESEADFTGIHPSDKLYVVNFTHKAKVSLDETGITAASSNTIIIKGMEDIPPFNNYGCSFEMVSFNGNFDTFTLGEFAFIKPVVVSRPFVAVIYDRDSKAVVYSGLVLDPR